MYNIQYIYYYVYDHVYASMCKVFFVFVCRSVPGENNSLHMA